jgi:hypothetical protein
MFNLNQAGAGFSAKFLNRMFRKIDGLNWDLQTGGTGVRTKDGSIATLIATTAPATPAVAASEGVAAAAATLASTSYNISVNPFEMFSTPIPAFATQVPFDRIATGDLIVGDRDILGWVVGKTGKTLKLLGFDGMHKTYQPPKVQILNQDGALVVQSLSGLFGGDAGVSGFQSSLMPLLMLTQGNSEGLDSILPILLFSQMQTSNPAAAQTAATVGGNPGLAASPMASMMPLLMMQSLKKGKGSSKEGILGGIDPMMLMMMSGGMGGGSAGGINPMMLLAMSGGLGGDDSDDDVVGIPRTAVNGGFTPALQKLRR